MALNTVLLRHPSRIRRFSVLVLVFVLSACGVTNQIKQVDNLRSIDGQSKVLMMPIDVELSQLTAAGLLEPQAEWTQNAEKYLDEHITNVMNDQGINIVKYEGDEGELASVPVQLEKLHQVVGFSVENHSFLPLPSRQEGQTWSLGSSVAILKEKTGADYAVFFFVRDTYATSGRVFMGLLLALATGSSINGGTQYGFASLVDLNSGDIVWFNRLLNNHGDLRTSEPAAEAVKSLLNGIPKPE